MKTAEELFDEHYLEIWEDWDVFELFTIDDVKDDLDALGEEYTPETLDELYNLLLEYQENEKDAYLDYAYEELSRKIEDCVNDSNLPGKYVREVLLDLAKQYDNEKYDNEK